MKVRLLLRVEYYNDVDQFWSRDIDLTSLTLEEIQKTEDNLNQEKNNTSIYKIRIVAWSKFD